MVEHKEDLKQIKFPLRCANYCIHILALLEAYFRFSWRNHITLSILGHVITVSYSSACLEQNGVVYYWRRKT